MYVRSRWNVWNLLEPLASLYQAKMTDLPSHSGVHKYVKHLPSMSEHPFLSCQQTIYVHTRYQLDDCGRTTVSDNANEVRLSVWLYTVPTGRWIVTLMTGEHVWTYIIPCVYTVDLLPDLSSQFEHAQGINRSCSCPVQTWQMMQATNLMNLTGALKVLCFNVWTLWS